MVKIKGKLMKRWEVVAKMNDKKVNVSLSNQSVFRSRKTAEILLKKIKKEPRSLSKPRIQSFFFIQRKR